MRTNLVHPEGARKPARRVRRADDGAHPQLGGGVPAVERGRLVGQRAAVRDGLDAVEPIHGIAAEHAHGVVARFSHGREREVWEV